LQDIIDGKLLALDNIIDGYTNDFVNTFYDQIEEMNTHLFFHERQALVWKALHKKQDFLDEVAALRDELAEGLGAIGSQFVEDMDAEFLGFTEFVN